MSCPDTAAPPAESSAAINLFQCVIFTDYPSTDFFAHKQHLRLLAECPACLRSEVCSLREAVKLVPTGLLYDASV